MDGSVVNRAHVVNSEAKVLPSLASHPSGCLLSTVKMCYWGLEQHLCFSKCQFEAIANTLLDLHWLLLLLQTHFECFAANAGTLGVIVCFLCAWIF